MGDDLATLGIEVRSDGVVTATDRLNRFDRQGRETERGAGRLERQTAKTNNQMATLSRTAAVAARALGALGVAFSVRAMTQFAEGAINAAESIADLNQRTGIATDTIQAFRLAADQSGSSASAADEALGRLSRRMGLFASREGGAAADAFQRLNIAVETTDGQMRTTEEVFREVADAIADTSSEAQAAALASEFFGETAGPQLAASLRDGAAGIDEYIDRLRETGRLFDDEIIAKAAEANAGLRDLRNAATQTIQVGFLDQISDSLGDARDIATDPAFQGGLEAIGRVLGFIATEALRGAENVARLVDALSNLDPRSALESLIELDPVIGTGRRVGDALRDRLGLSQTDLEAAQTELERQRQSMQELVTTRAQMERALETGLDVRGNPLTGLRREGMAGNLENREREIAALREQMAAQRELVRSLGEVEEATEPVIGDPGGSDGSGGSGLSGVGGAAGGAAVNVAELTQALRLENEQQAQLNDALTRGAEEHRNLVDAIELENVARENNIKFSTDQGQAWAREFRQGQRLRREYEQTENALADVASAVERARTPMEAYRSTVADIGALRPFARTAEDVEGLEHALSDARAEVDPLYSELRDLSSNIEDDFANAFESAFTKGESFGEALADNLRQTFTRLASEIARQLIFTPIINQVRGGLGLASQGMGPGGAANDNFSFGNLIGSGGSQFGTNLFQQFPGAANALGLTQTNALAGTGHYLANSAATTGLGNMVQGGLNNLGNPWTGPAGMLGNFGGNLLLGGDRSPAQQTNAGYGGMAGGIIGGAIGGPIGAGIGSFVGNVGGGLIGPGPSSEAGAGKFDLRTGSSVRDMQGNPSDQNRQFIEQQGQLAAQFNNQIADALGVNPAGGSVGVMAANDMLRAWVGGNDRTFGKGDTEELQQFIQRSIVDRLNGVNNAIKSALKKGIGQGNVEDTLSFLAQYNDGFFELNEAMTQGEAQMQALREQYQQVTAQAKELGLSTKDITANFKALTAQMRDDFDDNISLALLDMTDPTAAAIQRLDAEFEVLRRDAKALGGDLSQVNKLYKLQKEQILENSQIQIEALRTEQQVLQSINGTVDSLSQWLNAQAVNANSSLSPTERLAEAQRQFGSALSDVRGGDLSATGTLTGAADTLLSLGREQFASSVDFAALERSVRSQLQGVQATITSDRFIGDQVEKAIRQSSDENVNELRALRREVSLLRRDVQKAA